MFLRALRPSYSISRPAFRQRCQYFSSIVLDRDTNTISVPSLNASFPLVWLRDACQCPACVHPSTRQKLHRSSDFASSSTAHGSPSISPVHAEAVNGGLRVSWSDSDSKAAGAGTGRKDVTHESFYPASFLARHASPSALFAFHRDVFPEPWTASQFSFRNRNLTPDNRDPPSFSYTSLLTSDSTLLSVYKHLRRDGLVFISGVFPTIQQTSNEKCELRKLAERLSTIRRTFYGETWDVRNVRNSKNIAYTNLDLGLHMDILYFKEPPRYQILHALRNKVHGGQSLFVDALHAAHRLRSSSPEAFEILATTPVAFHYINDGHHLHYEHPTFEVSRFRRSGRPNLNSDSNSNSNSDKGEEVEITSINYSPPFQAPLPISTPPSFYSALAQFVELLEDPEARVTRLLQEGDAVIFDNRRVLHGRAGFEEIADASAGVEAGRREEGETSRWLKGCYLEEDPVLDRMRVLSARLEEKGSL